MRHLVILFMLLIPCSLIAGPDQEPLKLGVLAYRPKPQVLAQWQPVADYLQSSLVRPVELTVYDHAEINAAVEQHAVDMVITTANQFIPLQHTFGLSSPLATLIKYEGPYHLNAYGAVILTRADRSDIKSLADLADKRIAVVSLEAFGGYQMPALELLEAGITPPTGDRLRITGQPHDLVIQAVLEGHADAGFIRAGLLEALAQEGKLDLGRFKVINHQELPDFPYAVSTRLYPEWPVAVMPHIDREFSSRLAATLYLMPPEILNDSSLNLHGFGIPANYDVVENLLRRLRLPPFDQSPEITMLDLWHQYAWRIITLAGLLLLLAATSAGLIAMVRRSRRSLQELKQLTEKEKLILASLAEGVYGVDTEGRCIFINPRALTILGLKEKEVIAQDTHTLFHAHKGDGSSNPVASCPVMLALRDGKKRELEDLFIHTDGSKIPVWLGVSVMRHGDDTVGAVVVFQDISERKQAEQERQFHAELLANMDRINRAIQGAADLESMMRDVLDEVLDVFNCDRSFLMYPCDPSAKFWTVPMERTRPEYPGAGVLNEEIAMDGEVATTLGLLLNRSGALQIGPETEHPLPKEVSERYGFKSFMSVALYPKVGKAWQFGIHQCSYDRVWTDADERMLEEIGLRLSDGLTSLLVQHNMLESQRQLIEAQRLALLGNWELDLINNKLFWSDAIFHIFEIDKEKFGASYEAFIDMIHPDDREKVNNAYTESLKNRQPYNIVHRLMMKDGRVKYVRERCETCFDDSGKPLRSLGTIQDITEQKLKEDELARYRDHLEEEVHLRTEDLRLSRDAAEAANQAKSAFLANMSHELRTPLNAILGFSQMMSHAANLDESQQNNIEIINNSGEHLLKLINDVLEIAKIEAGEQQLKIAPFDLHDLVREVSDMMRQRAQQKGLQLELDQSSEFPRYIKGDEARVRQILVNLVSNAVKFTDKGKVTIRLAVKKNARHHLLLEVEDTGPGISADDQETLFKPFVQLPNSESQGGTGLGLSIVQQFVKMMGGNISVEGELGKGSLFLVELPLEEIEQEELTRLASEVRGEVIGLAPGQPISRILIAEDQNDSQLLLSNLMSDIGMEVKTASNGKECVQIFKDWKPDLIWMDQRMPIMDGEESTRIIRKLPGGEKVKIVAVTASAFKEQKEELLAAGMDDFVRKPYRFNEIYDCLENKLGLQFLYSDESHRSRSLSATLKPEMLGEVGAELRTALRDALDTLDRGHIEEVIQQISEKDRELAKLLKGLCANFDYPSILNALDEAER